MYGQAEILQTQIIGIPNDDAFQAIYLHHLVHDSLMNGRWDFFDPNRYYPVGYHRGASDGGNSLEMFVSGILRIFLPWPQWYGWSFFVWIPLNFLSFIPLGRYLWKSSIVALIVASCWSVAPFTLDFIAFGRLTQGVQFAIPFAILALLKLFEKRNRFSAIFLGIAMGACAWSYWYFAIFLSIFSFWFLIWGMPKRQLRTLCFDIALASIVFVLSCVPLLLVMYAPTLQGGEQPAAPMSALAVSPIFPDAVRFDGSGSDLWSMCMPSIWILAVFGWIGGKRRLLWGGCLILSILFSLGPAMFANEMVWFLPYYPMWKGFPLLDRMLHPERWMLIGVVFVHILAGEGLRFLCLLFPRKWLYPLIVSIPFWGVLHMKANNQWPTSSWKFQLPPLWQEVAKHKGAIIVVPVMKSSQTCQYQPFHGNPTLGGLQENQPWTYPSSFLSFVEGNGLIMSLFSLTESNITSFGIYERDVRELQKYGFGYIVFDNQAWEIMKAKNKSSSVTQHPLSVLMKSLGEPIYENSSGDAIWNIPRTGISGISPYSGRSIRSIGPADPIPEGAPPL